MKITLTVQDRSINISSALDLDSPSKDDFLEIARAVYRQVAILAKAKDKNAGATLQEGRLPGFYITGTRPNHDVNKIAGIKAIRAATGMGLKEAKDAIEQSFPARIVTVPGAYALTLKDALYDAGYYTSHVLV